MAQKKPGRPRHSPAQKAATAKARNKRLVATRRRHQWKTAGMAAAAAGSPLNVAIHLTWSAAAEEYNWGGPSIIGLPPAAAEKRLWAALRIVAAEAGVPFLAARGPEYSRARGHHLHLALHLPSERALRQAIRAVERLTQVPEHWVDLRGKTVRGPGGRRHQGVVAVSELGGWMVQRSVRPGDSGIDLVAYAGKADGKDQVEGQHRLSDALAALGRAYVAQAA